MEGIVSFFAGHGGLPMSDCESKTQECKTRNMSCFSFVYEELLKPTEERKLVGLMQQSHLDTHTHPPAEHLSLVFCDPTFDLNT